MPITGASLTFTPFLDEFTAWSSRAALQAFFENIRIAEGTPDVYGTFKQCEATVFGITVINNTDTYNIIVDGVSAGQVPTKESFVQLQNAFIALQASYYELLTKLRTAKVLKV